MGELATRTVSAEELATPLLPYEQARRAVLEAFRPLEPVSVPLDLALGRTAAGDVTSELDVPGFANSAMDGYAVVAADTEGASEATPAVLELAGDLPAGPAGAAGSAPTLPLARGTASKVMTGAPLPEGADAVVPWEQTAPNEGRVAVVAEAAPGAHVRPSGEDVVAGQVVVRDGDVLRPVHLGALASIGRTHVLVRARPSVAVLSTGSELVAPGSPLGAAQVYNSNATLVSALCRAAGAEVSATGMVGDDPEAVAAWLRGAAAGADLVVTTGGASVGEHDWVRDVLAREGELTLWRVAVKPGKPVALGSVAGTPVLALPGNPGSALACSHAFLLPALRALAGSPPDPASVPARLSGDVKGNPTRTVLCPVELDGTEAVPLPVRSGALSHLVGFDGFAVVPPGGLPAGAPVTVELVP